MTLEASVGGTHNISVLKHILKNILFSNNTTSQKKMTDQKQQITKKGCRAVNSLDYIIDNSAYMTTILASFEDFSQLSCFP